MSNKEKIEDLMNRSSRLAWDIKETTDDMNLINQANDLLTLIKSI